MRRRLDQGMKSVSSTAIATASMSKLQSNRTAGDKPRRGRPPQTSGASDAADSLLDAAEVLFAERGFYGVATRAVSTKAGVDDALIYYHFTNKRGLFEAVLARRAEVLNKIRLESLHNYRSVTSVITVRAAIAAFIFPMIDLSLSNDKGWKSYFALVAQIDNTPWGGEIIHRFFDEVVHVLLDIISLALPTVKPKELFWAYNFLAGSMMLALSETARVDRLSEGLCCAGQLTEVRERLVTFCAGGFEAVAKVSMQPKTSPSYSVRPEGA